MTVKQASGFGCSIKKLALHFTVIPVKTGIQINLIVLGFRLSKTRPE
jgi:hypothetical protein